MSVQATKGAVLRGCILIWVCVFALTATGARATTSQRPPSWWIREAMCVHQHESTDWHRAGTDYLGRPSPYYGGMQFLVSTWRSVGGSGLPSQASPPEQLYRAWLVWRRDGGSWREWGTARVCGLR